MTRPRVVVFGYGALALAGLDAMERLGVRLAAVVVPGNRTGSDVDLVTARADARGWTRLVQPPRRLIAPFVDALSALQPALLFVWSYSMLLPPELLALPRLGAVNLHGGLLPQYRGGHVMNWAIANGERETGVTLHYLDEGIDTGPVIAEQRVSIDWRDDAASVRDKLRAAGQLLLERWWPAIEAGTAPRIPQPPSQGRYYPLRTREDGRVRWSTANTSIYHLVRALVAPWPGAFTTIGGTTLVMRRVEPVDTETGAAPGTVTRIDGTVVWVSAGQGSVQLVATEIDRQPASAADLRRAGVVAGVQLGKV